MTAEATTEATDTETSTEKTSQEDQSIRLPDDHPLVKTLAIQKETIKELKAKAQRLDEYEESQKSELQKALDRAEAAEQKAIASELATARAEVAIVKGLTPTQAKRLMGTTREELEQDADELLADLKAQTKTAPTSEGQGKVGEAVGGPKQITSRDQLKSMTSQQIEEARKNGELDGLLGVKS